MGITVLPLILLGFIGKLVFNKNDDVRLRIKHNVYPIDCKYIKLLEDCDPLDIYTENKIMENISYSIKYKGLHMDDYN